MIDDDALEQSAQNSEQTSSIKLILFRCVHAVLSGGAGDKQAIKHDFPALAQLIKELNQSLKESIIFYRFQAPIYG